MSLLLIYPLAVSGAPYTGHCMHAVSQVTYSRMLGGQGTSRSLRSVTYHTRAVNRGARGEQRKTGIASLATSTGSTVPRPPMYTPRRNRPLRNRYVWPAYNDTPGFLAVVLTAAMTCWKNEWEGRMGVDGWQRFPIHRSIRDLYV